MSSVRVDFSGNPLWFGWSRQPRWDADGARDWYDRVCEARARHPLARLRQLPPLEDEPRQLGALARATSTEDAWVDYWWACFGPRTAFHALIAASRAQWRGGVLRWSDDDALLWEDAFRALVDGADVATRTLLWAEAQSVWPTASGPLRHSLLRTFRDPAWLAEALHALPEDRSTSAWRQAGALACLAGSAPLARSLLEPAITAGLGWAVAAVYRLPANLVSNVGHDAAMAILADLVPRLGGHERAMVLRDLEGIWSVAACGVVGGMLHDDGAYPHAEAVRYLLSRPTEAVEAMSGETPPRRCTRALLAQLEAPPPPPKIG